MENVFDITIKCLGMILMALVTYIVVPAIKDWRNNKLDEKQRDQLTFWIETGVLWAKQWLQSKSGEEKKAEVMKFVMAKVHELNLPYTQDDVDKAIEAVYNAVKDVTDAASGQTTPQVAADK